VLRGRLVVLGALVALDLAFLFVGGRDVDAEQAAAPPPAGLARTRVGLVFDVGGRGDRSFNDAAYLGLMRAKNELGSEVEVIEPSEGADRESAIRIFAARGFDLVIGVGFIFSQDLTELAREYPRVHFACIDYSPPFDEAGKPLPIPPNLAGLKFREEEGSFLVGAVAALESKSKVVGFVGGMDVPLIHKFEAGYQAGVKATCPTCRVIVQYAGSTPVAFKDPARGAAIATSQLGQGADVLYHASGSTGLGVIRVAREKGVWAIGVDSDQYDDGVSPESPGKSAVLTSMVKRVDVAVFEAIRSVAKGDVAGGWSGGVRVFGLKEDGVDYIHDGEHGQAIRPETKAKIEELRARIVRGEIRVPQPGDGG
jgi:basic membrane protein A